MGEIESTVPTQSALQQMIPEIVGTFLKLQNGDPYRFEEWASDRTGATCLYYLFHSHDHSKIIRKRVVLAELHAAMQHLSDSGRFDRSAYRRLCPISASAGPCGFTVMGRIFETLLGAHYSGLGKGFVAQLRPFTARPTSASTSVH